MIRSLCIVLLTSSLGACSTPAPARFFTLMPASTDISTSRQQGVSDRVIVVGPVTIPPALDQTKMVLSKGDHEMDVRDSERWASPLKDEITAALAARLSPLAGDATVAAYPQAAGDRADVRILVDFSRLELKLGSKVTLEALWSIKDSGTGLNRHGRTVVSIPTEGEGYERLVAAQGKALDRLARDLAADLPK